jgi:SPW repeat
VLADKWWFWLATAVAVGLSGLAAGRFRSWSASLRRAAVARQVVEAGPGRHLDVRAGGFWSDLSWLSVLLGAWVVASPWIWGYEEAGGAIATDAVTGGAVIGLTLAGVVFPSLNAPSVLAGLWLVLAPWIVGYGNEGGPVGLSDVLAGLAIAALAIAALASATKRIAPGAPMPVGRVRGSVEPDE